MKRLVLLSAALLAIAGASQAQTTASSAGKSTRAVAVNQPSAKAKKQERKEIRQLEGREVSSLSKNNFASDFRDATNATWTHGKYFDEVTFTSKGATLTAYYDYMSNLVGTTSSKHFADLPAAAQKQINKQWTSKGYTVDKVIMFDDNEENDTDMILYNNPFDDADNYFVELHNNSNNRKIILQSDMEGLVSFFKEVN